MLERMERNLETKFSGFVGRIWVGFSGGLDSTLLLYLFSQLSGKDTVTAIHINHGLSERAADWESHCRTTAQELNVGFVCKALGALSGNVEYQARRSRYRVFEELARQGDVVATAHHQDDDVESMLWQLFTGRALVGIRESRRLGAATLWRPLLAYTRAEIGAAAQENSLKWVDDHTNIDVSFDRNFLRHKVVPGLTGRFPGFSTNILNLKLDEPPQIDEGPLSIEGNAVDEVTIRAWLWTYGLTPRQSIVKEVVKQLDAAPDAMPMVRVMRDLSVRRFKNHLHLVRQRSPLFPSITVAGVEWHHSNGCMTWEKAARGLVPRQRFDVKSRLDLPDRSIKLGTIHRSLGKLFQEFEIPPWERDSWPIICDGEIPIGVPGIAFADECMHANGVVPKWHPEIAHAVST